MRYYKFNRSKDLGPLESFRRSYRKKAHQTKTNRSRMLSSGYYENEAWGALHKCWKGYVIAKNNYEHNKMIEYATRTQKLQYELGQTISQFSDLDMPEFGFLPEDYTTNMDDESSSEEATELEFNNS